MKVPGFVALAVSIVAFGLPAQAQQEGAVTVTAGKDGFSIRSADGASSLKLRGIVQIDSVTFFGDDTVAGTDSIFLRRARPILEATLGRIFDFRLMPDFAQGKTVLYDAYTDLKFHPLAKLRVGKFKAPVGLERLQSASDTAFITRAAPTQLVPNRDIGLQLHGDLRDGLLTYAVMGSNGTVDGGSSDADAGDGKEIAARVFVHPFRAGDSPRLEGIGFGFAGTHGRNSGTPSSPGIGGYKTSGDLTYFSYRSDGTPEGTVVADGTRTRWSPQAYAYVGRFGAMAEYVSSTQDVVLGASRETITNTAWQGTVTVLLTGDRATYRGVSPKAPFEPEGPGRGAVEIAARYARLDVDGGAFPLFADPAKSASRADEWAVGVGWWMIRNVRLMLGYGETRFEGGADSGADRETEKILLSRVQVSF